MQDSIDIESRLLNLSMLLQLYEKQIAQGDDSPELFDKYQETLAEIIMLEKQSEL